MASPPHDPDPLSRIQVGMRVYDSEGREIGTVDVVDPGEVAISPGGLRVDHDLPAPEGMEASAMERLRRTGYIRLDSPVLRGPERYVERDRVVSVAHDHLQIRTRKT